MSQIYTVKCNGVPIEVPAEEVQGRAAALDRYLADPEVATRFPEHFKHLFKPQNDVDVMEALGTVAIKNGWWSLSCSAPRTMFWMARPSPEHMFTAGMGWDPEEERWFITGIRMNNIKKR